MGTRSTERGGKKGLTIAELPVDANKGCWDRNKRGTANPDAGQGLMEEDICNRSDLVPTY